MAYPSRPRVLYILSSRGWGGMEMHPLVVARELRRRGHGFCAALAGGSPASVRARSQGIPHVTLPFRWYLDPVTWAGLKRAVAAIGADIVHVHWTRDAWHGLLLAGLLRRNHPLVLTRHMASPATRRRQDPLHRILAARLDAVVAISNYVGRNCLETWPCLPPKKVQILYYGIGPEAVGDPQKGTRIRETYGLSSEDVLVGLVGQISPDKRQDLFLEAAKRVLRQRPETRFLVAGASTEPAYAEALRQSCRDPVLRDRVILAGFREDVPDLMQALDIAVVPSKAESLGLVAIEAMANGRPVVGSCSGALPEILEHGANGLLFTAGDAESFAEAILTLVGDKTKRLEMGMAARRTWEERFPLDREIQETETLYASLL